MLSRYAVASFLVISASSPALAENYVVGAKGGMYCKTSDDLANQTLSALNGSHEAVPGCGVLKPGAVINASTLNKSDSLVAGTGTSPGILGGGDFAFMTVSDGEPVKSEPVKPALRVAGDPSRTYKVVGPDDVRATPSKWVGRDLSFPGVHVYWVQDDDVRFLTTSSITIFGKNIAGKAKDIDFLRSNCETTKEAVTAKCRVTIHFSYSAFQEDNPNPLTVRLVLSTDDIAIIRR